MIDDLIAAARAGAEAAIRNVGQPVKVPGSVTAIDTHVRVQLSGDTESIPVADPGGAAYVGQLVMLEFWPGGSVTIA